MSIETITSKIKTIAENTGSMGHTIKFALDEGVVYLDGSGENNAISNEDKEAECTISLATADMMDLLNGDLNAMGAFMSGKLKVDGDLAAAMKLQSLFA